MLLLPPKPHHLLFLPLPRFQEVQTGRQPVERQIESVRPSRYLVLRQLPPRHVQQLQHSRGVGIPTPANLQLALRRVGPGLYPQAAVLAAKQHADGFVVCKNPVEIDLAEAVVVETAQGVFVDEAVRLRLFGGAGAFYAAEFGLGWWEPKIRS